MGMEMDKLNRKKKRAFSAWMPVLGLFLGACMLVIAYALSPWAVDWLDRQSNRFPPPVLSAQMVEIITTLVIFGVLLIIAWTLVSVFAPRPKDVISSKDLSKERNEKIREMRERKKRRDRMRQQALDDHRQNS